MMDHPSKNEQHALYVQNMFGRIAQRYDLMNRVMTAGQDIHWREEAIRLAQIPKGGKILDIGAGTGDLSREALQQQPLCHPIAADFTLEMMQVGRRNTDHHFSWCSADATRLPFRSETFDAVVSGFLLRNVTDITQALHEQYRVLKSGGRIVCLDTTRPKPNLFSPAINFHLNIIIPFLGKIIAGDGDAYSYLPQSTQHFLFAEELAEKMQQANFQNVSFKRFMFGTIAIHWGVKE
ncbi:MAG: ubiquinone/menaquinone biosynthesis methyltransferase [Anaerolineales bacterium]